MAIATGTALAIGLGASAAGGMAKAKLQSNAAKKASKAQEQAVGEARNIYSQGLGQLGSLYAPYINSGAGAMGTIGRLTTPGPGARFASPGPPNAMPQQPTGNMAVPSGGYGGYGMQMPMQQGPPRQGFSGGPFSQMAPQGPPPGYGGPPPPSQMMNTWSRG